MTRSRRIAAAAGIPVAAAVAMVALAGQSAGASHSARELPALPAERVATADPYQEPTPGGGRGNDGYGQTVPPAGPVPSETPVPPGTAPSEAPCCGESPGEVPVPGEAPLGGELPVTGVSLGVVAMLGVVLAMAGAGLRFLARRRRLS